MPPDQPQPAEAAATPETVRADVLRLRTWLKSRRFRELTQALEARQSAFESDFLLEAAVE